MIKFFCDVIRNLIYDHVSYSASLVSPQDWWEFLKVSIKNRFLFLVESAVNCAAIVSF